MCNQKNNQKPQSIDTGRGVIKDNYLAALVTSKVFRTQVVKAKKGKGSFNRKEKHQGRESYLIAA
ncbi:ribosome alternative rescue factor ArfA [Pseudoalteromonas sp. C2R02]|uniref:alternative ribosome-rescue factor A n=1 Tax=Pseudoalteromonas sp. C2R02 TaxID=2841565 RepID=UPI001C098532|nr:ribosome alternative rescue factor ArfA [Pseudoalteromonas sp. C2R02]MBU2968565.1 ribosome alternative rescue factor ArfA [Pseudoalteromonas sp. C2R02]